MLLCPRHTNYTSYRFEIQGMSDLMTCAVEVSHDPTVSHDKIGMLRPLLCVGGVNPDMMSSRRHAQTLLLDHMTRHAQCHYLVSYRREWK